jgi:hypothetical protein
MSDAFACIHDVQVWRQREEKPRPIAPPQRHARELRSAIAGMPIN